MIMSNNFVEVAGKGFYTFETNTMKLNIPTNVFTAPSALRSKETVPIVEWKFPKPSIQYLFEFLKRAAYIYNLYKSEMEVFVLWDTVNKKHVFYIPEQEVSGASVNFTWNMPENCILMFELHSHHTMGISFSSTDDTNDSNVDILPHISAVLKNIDKFNLIDMDANIDIRLSYIGNKITLKLKDIFEIDTYSMPQIKKYIPHVVIANKHNDILNAYYGGSNTYTPKNVIERKFDDKSTNGKYKQSNVYRSAFDKLEDSETILDFVNKRIQEELEKKNKVKTKGGK